MKHERDRVGRHFEQEWSDYDRRIREVIPFYDEVLHTMVNVVRKAVPEPRSILDLGTGTGNLAGQLLAAFPAAHLAGIDLASRLLDVAAKRLAQFGDRVSLTVADIANIGIERNRYDVVVSSFVFHHLEDVDKRRLYAGVRASLGTGGLLLNADFVDSGSRFWSETFDGLRVERLKEAGWALEDIRKFYIDHRALELPAPMDEQLTWLREAGYSDVECFWKYLNLALFGGSVPGERL